MTTGQQIETGWIEDAVSDYPTLLRIGHQYETTLGQRLAVGGFRGPQDIAIDSDNSFYVLNRGSPNLDQVPPTRYVRVNIDDDGYENDIVLNTDGAAEASDVKYPSPVMCVLDSRNVLFHTDERSNIVVAIKTTGEAVGEWGESGDGVGYLNGPSGITLDAAENLWIVNSRDHRIQHFTRSRANWTIRGVFQSTRSTARSLSRTGVTAAYSDSVLMANSCRSSGNQARVLASSITPVAWLSTNTETFTSPTGTITVC